MPHTTKRIGIDARFYGPIGKGLGRYTQEVVDNIIRLDQENEYVIFLRRDNFDELKTDGLPRVKKVLAEIRWYTLAEQLVLPWLIYKEKLDLIHFPHFNVPILCPTKLVVTIHDLILINFPTKKATTLGPITYFIKNLGYRLTIWLALMRSKAIIAVSQFTKDDIVQHFGVKPEKIIVTYEGVADFAQSAGGAGQPDNAQSATLIKHRINRPYILYVGNAYPHKNLEQLLNVFNDLLSKRPNLQLVLVGKEDHFYAKIKQQAKDLQLSLPGQSSPVIFTDYVNDQELADLYSHATLYVFASFYEGFGLPPLEAMAKGLAVASSDTTSMPEILGDAAVYFNPRDQADIQAKISALLDDPDLRSELINKGYAQIRKYSWQTCAESTLAVYRANL
jgi:glycosyltransferase involved in cell wall biosynthesis